MHFHLRNFYRELGTFGDTHIYDKIQNNSKWNLNFSSHSTYYIKTFIHETMQPSDFIKGVAEMWDDPPGQFPAAEYGAFAHCAQLSLWL